MKIPKINDSNDLNKFDLQNESIKNKKDKDNKKYIK